MKALRAADRPTHPRALHPGAWWLWALGLATAATRTTNPLLLVLLVSAAGYVVVARRTNAPWARSYAAFLKLGALVIGIRIVFQMIFGAGITGDTVLLRLPELPLPEALEGVRIGGPITAEALASAAYEGLKLATILACVGAANALANPKQLLRSVPGALYELGVAVVVAMTFAPQLVTDAARARSARRLRGQSDRGLRAVRAGTMPVLEGAMERSLALAAAMDSRGYGRLGPVSKATRRLTAVLVLGGLLGVCVGVYGVLGASLPAPVGVPLLLVGLALACLGLVVGGRRSIRTRYRPTPWAIPEWLVAACGVATAAVFIGAELAGVEALRPSLMPLATPSLPLVCLAGIATAIAPAWLAPPPASTLPTEPAQPPRSSGPADPAPEEARA